MEDTACKDCPFKRMGFDECPNYIETIWHQKDNPQPKIVRDCAPRRQLLMTQELYNRAFGMQQQIGQLENAHYKVEGTLSNFCKMIEHLEKMKEIEEQ